MRNYAIAGAFSSGKGGTVTVDNELSADSNNPVANKAIAAKIAELEEKIGSSDGYSIITGTYIGDGADDHGESQVIDIGVTPRIIIVQPINPTTTNFQFYMAEKDHYMTYGDYAVRVIENGFEAKDKITFSKKTYLYVAFVEKSNGEIESQG